MNTLCIILYMELACLSGEGDELWPCWPSVDSCQDTSLQVGTWPSLHQ